MPRKRSFVEHPLTAIGFMVPPIKPKRWADLLTLRRRLGEVTDPTRWEFGFDGICFRVLQRASVARAVYGKSVRSFAEARNTVAKIAELTEQLAPLLEKCRDNDLLPSHHTEKAVEPLTDIEKLLEPKLADIADDIATGHAVFWPKMILDYPVDSCLFSAQILHNAIRSGINELEREYSRYEFPSRPESDAVALLVFELWRDYGKEGVRYPGSESGPPARLYYQICKLADLPPGNAVHSLRKFSKHQQNNTL